jgi:hypothetical protein
VFRIGVTKVDWDVAHVAMAIHVCFKYMFQMLHLYQTYVASTFIWMLHIHACCKCILQVFQVFFIRPLQAFHLDFAYVCNDF